MITQLSQDSIAEYASDAQTIDEPTGIDYSQGVQVGRTVPAKWWNWLFRAATKRLEQSKTDAQGMLTELQNAVTDAGLTLDDNDNTQLSQAVVTDANTQIQEFIADKKGLFTRWQPVGTAAVHDYMYAANTSWIWDDECCVYVVPDSDSQGYKVYGTMDFVSWIELHISVGQQCRAVTLAKFAGKHFILCTHTTPSGGNPAVTYALYTFDGAQFTLVSTDTGISVSAYSINSYIPVMFVTEQRLGIIHMTGSDQSTSSPFVLRVRTTTDGVNWTTTTYNSGTGFNNLHSNGYPALRPVHGYEFPDGVVVGSAIIGSSTVTILNNLINWYPRATTGLNSAVTLKLNNTLVIKGGSPSAKIYTAPISGSSPTVTEHTIADITDYSLICTLHNNSIVIIKDNSDYYRFSTDGYTFTNTGVKDTIYELNGTYFSGTKKSTDLVNWTELSIPAQYTGVKVSNVIEWAGAVIATLGVSHTIVSLDLGETWIESAQYITAATLPSIFRPLGLPSRGTTLYTLEFTDISISTTSRQTYATANSINAVVGHTLYLN